MQPSVTLRANAAILEQLSAQLTDRPGSVVPFIGAGTSVPYGMPGWRAFLNELLDVARDHSSRVDEIRELIDEGSLERAAELLRDELGPPYFETSVQSTFRLQAQQVSNVMHRIITLADGLIVTTNYDHVIEDAWQQQLTNLGIRPDVDLLLPSLEHDLARALNGGGHGVLKLHGDIRKPETWVLTSEEYERLYQSPSFQNFLSRFFSCHVPLFIGYSLSEQRIIRQMRDSTCVGYAILADSEAERRRLAPLRDCIRVIWLRPEDAAGHPYDVLEPVLHWLTVRRKVGRVSWQAEPVPQPWTHKLKEFHAGKFDEALAWIRERWDAWPSWELALEYLRFADYAGRPAEWKTYVDVFRASLHGEPTTVTQHGIDYYFGRLQGQAGRWAPALALHAANRPHPPYPDHHQVRSWFEEGQLRFRTEDFERAEGIFESLFYLLIGQRTLRKEFVDVLKFRATTAILDTVYDAPGSDVFWVQGAHRDAARALEFTQAAFREADENDYEDGRAWALTIEALAHETAADAATAEQRFASALTVTGRGECRAATPFHVRLYYAAYLRRAGRLDEADAALHKAAELVLPTDRIPDKLKLAEQSLLLAWVRNDLAEGRRQYAIIASTHADTQNFLDGSTRLERRLLRLRADRRLVPPVP